MSLENEGKIIAIVFSALNRTGFDFVGEFLGRADGMIQLKNALCFSYKREYGNVSDLAPLHMPLGLIDFTKCDTFLQFPDDGTAYIVMISDAVSEDYAPILKIYRDFFAAKESVH